MTVGGVDVTRAYRKRGPGWVFLLGRIPLPGPWAQEGACRGWPTSWWFPERGTPEALVRAREICAGCPVRIECADYALEHSGLLGLWGGLDVKQRRLERTRRRLRRAS